MHTSNAPYWGYDFLNKRYFDKNMNFLREFGDAL